MSEIFILEIDHINMLYPECDYLWRQTLCISIKKWIIPLYTDQVWEDFQM